MSGLALSLFFEKNQRPLCKHQGNAGLRIGIKQWTLVERLLALKKISYVDIALAEFLLKDLDNALEETALFICYLSLAARAGHLCVRIDSQGIFPKLKQSWPSESRPQEQQEIPIDEFLLEAMIQKGVQNLPEHVMTSILSEETLQISTPLCRFGPYYYLQRHWTYESLFLFHWKRIAQQRPILELNHQKIEKQLNELVKTGYLLNEQAEAILEASRNSLTIIAGGPGTGKTYTAGQLIRIFYEAMDPEQREKCELALAAPTGKAASNLQNSFRKALGNLEFKKIEAMTLHRLLGVKSLTVGNSEWNTEMVLTADIILIDESSMIDVKLMARLLAAIKPGARLILLGDKHQLPPVEAGGVFADLMNHHRPIVELKTCLRAELKGIVNFASAIHQGDCEGVLRMLSTDGCQDGVKRWALSEVNSHAKLEQKHLIHYVEPFFSRECQSFEHPQKLLESYQRFRLLSPVRQGPLGVEELNRLLLKQMLKKASLNSWMTVPLMIVRNDYRLGLVNGEVGVLVCRPSSLAGGISHFQEGDYAIFSDDSESGVKKIPALMLPRYEYAYCLSVHKSQGSEFEHVFLVHPEGGERFGREVLYTAATRARRCLEVFSTDLVLKMTIEREGQRLSGIRERLEKI